MFSSRSWRAILVEVLGTDNAGALRCIILSQILYKIRKTRESRSLRFDRRHYWLVPNWKYCRIVNPITGSYAQIVQFSSGKMHDKQLKMISILVESKFIAFTNDAWQRFWNMDWNVVLLLQVKR